MDKQNSYLKTITVIKSRLCLALELLQTMPPSGVRTLLEKLADLLPFPVDVYLRDDPFNVDYAEERQLNFKNAFIILVQKTISALEQIYRESNLQFYTNIELQVSMGLDDSDPAARDEYDNFIVNIIVPWQVTWPEIILNVPITCQEAADRLYDYILRTTHPSLEAKDFSRVGYLYADITLTEAKGYRFNKDTTKAIETIPVEVADLLEMKNLPEISPISSNIPSIAKTCKDYIEEMIKLIDQLLNNSTKKDTTTDQLAIKLAALLHDHGRIREYGKLGECLMSYANRPDWKLFDTENHAQMACLDSVMREIEELAVENIDRNHQNTETSFIEKRFEITIEDFPLENILTFWTNKANSTCPIPFWEVETSTRLFKDGEDWHEFHPYKPMCYLSHVAFVDGDINLEELKDVDCITWEMRFRHDITVNLTGTSKEHSFQGFPLLYPALPL